MAYWKKKTCKLVQCYGKTKNGDRCSNKIYLEPKSKVYTCHLHSDQVISFTYGSTVGLWKDVAIIIGRYIDNASDFHAFSKVCRSTAKAAAILKKEKITQFKKRVRYVDNGFMKTVWCLPNGDLLDENETFIRNSHYNYSRL